MASTGGWRGRIAVRFESAARATRAACAIAASVALDWPAGTAAQTITEFLIPTANSGSAYITTGRTARCGSPNDF
jgi:hypothetical protein